MNIMNNISIKPYINNEIVSNDEYVKSLFFEAPKTSEQQTEINLNNFFSNLTKILTNTPNSGSQIVGGIFGTCNVLNNNDNIPGPEYNNALALNNNLLNHINDNKTLNSNNFINSSTTETLQSFPHYYDIAPANTIERFNFGQQSMFDFGENGNKLNFYS